MKTVRFASAIALLATLWLVGCAAPTPEPAAAPPAPTATPTSTVASSGDAVAVEPTATPAVEGQAYPLPAPQQAPPATGYPEPAQQPAQAASMPRVDGAVDPAEYRHELLVDDFALRWSNDGEHLYVAMQAPTTGWVAVGLDPDNRMQGASFILGAVVDGKAVISDAFGMAPVGPNHPEDTELGGAVDVVAFAGAEANGLTLIEFQIPLDSGDKYDKPLAPGETYPVLVAFSSGDQFTAMHAFRAATEITLDPAD